MTLQGTIRKLTAHKSGANSLGPLQPCDSVPWTWSHTPFLRGRKDKVPKEQLWDTSEVEQVKRSGKYSCTTVKSTIIKKKITLKFKVRQVSLKYRDICKHRVLAIIGCFIYLYFSPLIFCNAMERY